MPPAFTYRAKDKWHSDVKVPVLLGGMEKLASPFPVPGHIQRFLSLCFTGWHVACTFPAASHRAAFPVPPVCKGGVCVTPWGIHMPGVDLDMELPHETSIHGWAYAEQPVGVGSICLTESFRLERTPKVQL